MRGPKSFCHHKVTLKRKPVKELISKSLLGKHRIERGSSGSHHVCNNVPCVVFAEAGKVAGTVTRMAHCKAIVSSRPGSGREEG